MKRACLALAIAVVGISAIWAQPKIAVLDALIPQNMDPSVIVPVTEKIVERLVVSGRFTVLDRANIESVLKEREFQVSGMVSDQDVVTAGKYLGADFVVAVKVQKVGDTYFISAKMIAIKTGVIANQTSAQGEGKLTALIALAEQVGEVLSGGAVLAQSAAGGDPQDISKPNANTTIAPASNTPRTEAPRTFSNGIVIGLSYMPVSWVEKYSDLNGDGEVTDKISYVALSLAYEMKYFGLGLSFGSGSSIDWEDTYSGNSGTINQSDNYLGLRIYGKLPITFGRVSIVPIVGLEYLLETAVEGSDGTDYLNTLSSFGKSLYKDRIFLEAGLGLNFRIASHLALSASCEYGYKIPSSNDSDYITDQESYGYFNESVSSSAIIASTSISFLF
jgi:hypothetical protein